MRAAIVLLLVIPAFVLLAGCSNVAMTDANASRFVRAMLSEAQQMATEKTGEVVGGAVMALAKRALLFMFLGSIVYAVGGWSALAALGKFFASRD